MESYGPAFFFALALGVPVTALTVGIFQSYTVAGVQQLTTKAMPDDTETNSIQSPRAMRARRYGSGQGNLRACQQLPAVILLS
jgi:hypothetical protein